ncbi:MAG: hypothetical protein L3J13_03935 [Devosiaceae bacterium]|nr:hypothetical protein [Devosiaceae bacterium]
MISFAGVNLLLFSVIPHVGPGYAGLMYAPSPVLTWSGAGIIALGIAMTILARRSE